MVSWISQSGLSLRPGELEGLARRRLRSARWRASCSLSAPGAAAVVASAAEAAERPVPVPVGAGPSAVALPTAVRGW
eukprot:12906047-Prorocentrum_lima.AAC.1